MRNPLRTFRKRSYKPLSKNKMRRYQGYDTLNEELFEAQLALQKWFIGYMEQLKTESKTVNLPTLSGAKAAN